MRNLLVWVVVQDERDRVLLGRRDGSAYGHGLWGLPEAAAREVSEETGLTLDPAALAVLGVRRYEVDGAQGTDFLFRVRSWEGTPQPLHKTSEVAWFAPGDLPDDALPWLAPLLDAYLNRGVFVTEQLSDVRAARELA